MARWTRLLLPLGLAALGCGDGENAADDAAGHSIYVVPASLDALDGKETFFDHPWPSDFRKDPDGFVRFSGYPNPLDGPAIGVYIDSLAGVLDGFSPVAAGFLRFTVPLDPATLPPTPKDALDPGSSVQLIDVDPASPEFEQRKLVSLLFRAEEGVYWPPNTLAFMPTLGYPLLPATRYALVVTDGVRAEGGGRIGPSSDLRRVLGLASSSGATRTLHDAVSDALAELRTLGIAKEHIVQLAVFTTNDPTAQTEKIADFVHSSYPAPTVLDWSANDQLTGLLDVYEGHYGPSPNFQKGNIPFEKPEDGGALAFDDSGTPVVQSEFNLRFALSVPDATKCPMPSNGYPIVVYAHGTGGNYRSFLSPGGEGRGLAGRCIATMGIDQIFHGTRPGSGVGNVEILFFNVDNPVAARANGPESAIDVVQQARLFTDTKITVPANVSRTGNPIAFDPDKLAFMGHSQGGLNGPLFLAVDNQAKGGMLSGSGSMISIALLEKTKPVNVAGLVKNVFLGLKPAEYEELSPFHPAMTLAQSIVDPTDPIHYVPKIALRPREGFSPKSLMQTEGVNADGTGDSYAPPHGIEVQAVAGGLPPQTPVIHEIAELPWGDLTPVTIPPEGLSGNLAGGKASGVLAQWSADQASDGHFVIYDIPKAMQQATGFLRNVFDEPNGRVPAP
jgi:hypothetical protein